MRHVFCVLCTRAIIDQTNQSLSMIDIIDSLLGVPDERAEGALAVRMDFISLWTRDEISVGGQQGARLSLIAPDGSQLGERLEYEVDLSVARNARMVTRFAGFPFKGLGRHRILVEVEEVEDSWKVVAEWPVDVASVATVVSQKAES